MSKQIGLTNCTLQAVKYRPVASSGFRGERNQKTRGYVRWMGKICLAPSRMDETLQIPGQFAYQLVIRAKAQILYLEDFLNVDFIQ